jgi:hypothetical protein
LRDEHRFKVRENRALRKVYGTKWDEVTGDPTRLNNEEIHDLYLSLNIGRFIKSRKMRWAGKFYVMGRTEGHAEIGG